MFMSIRCSPSGTLSTEKENIKKYEIAGIEVKGEGSGLAYATPSLYAADWSNTYQQMHQKNES